MNSINIVNPTNQNNQSPIQSSNSYVDEVIARSEAIQQRLDHLILSLLA